MGTREGGVALRKTMIEKFGSEEAWKQWMRSLGSIGGKLSRTGGFFQNRELARTAGAKGGTISRRKWSETQRKEQAKVMQETMKRRYAK